MRKAEALKKAFSDFVDAWVAQVPQTRSSGDGEIPDTDDDDSQPPP